MQSISHWGQFEIPAAGTENFKEALSQDQINYVHELAEDRRRIWSEISPAAYDSKYLHGRQDYQLYFDEIPKRRAWEPSFGPKY